MKKVILLSCTKAKLGHQSPAKDMYMKSAYFRAQRSFAEASGCPWFILSAKYGLLEPDEEIEPYDETLKTKSPRQRRIWAEKVYAMLKPKLSPGAEVVILAGLAYSEYLKPLLLADGFRVSEPLKGRKFGQRIAWLQKSRGSLCCSGSERSKTFAAGGQNMIHSSQADRIRRFVISQYIEPARARGDRTVSVRAGDVAREMGLYGRVPNICQVLRGKRLQEMASIRLIQAIGPHQSTTTTFVYEILPEQHGVFGNLDEQLNELVRKVFGEAEVRGKNTEKVTDIPEHRSEENGPVWVGDFSVVQEEQRREGPTWTTPSELHGLTNPEKVQRFLQKNAPRPFCDDCLSVLLNIFPRQQIYQICAYRLAPMGKIMRQKGKCVNCGRYKTVNSVGKT